MKLRNIAAAILGMAFLAMASFAQTAKIEGNVTGVDGQPLQGAVIRFTRTDMRGNAQTKTDKKGHYIYMGRPVGAMYTIACEVDGKKVDEAQNIKASLVDVNNPNTNDGVILNFDLKKKQALTATTQQALNEAAATGKISDDLARRLTDDQKEAIEKAAKEREAALRKDKDLNDAFSAGMAAMEAKQ